MIITVSLLHIFLRFLSHSFRTMWRRKITPKKVSGVQEPQIDSCKNFFRGALELQESDDAEMEKDQKSSTRKLFQGKEKKCREKVNRFKGVNLMKTKQPKRRTV